MDSFAALLSELQASHNRAAEVILERFTARLVGLARLKLDADIRRKVDPEDIVQSVYRTFFRRHGEGGFEFTGWDSLWGLLSLITVRKCCDQVGFYGADKRNSRRERGLTGNPSDGACAPLELVDREPAPDDALAMVETLEQVLRDFDLEDRQVIELYLQGFSVAEISQTLGRAERSVRRIRERVRQRLMQLIHGE